MAENITKEKEAEAGNSLSAKVLFPCECGSDNDFHIRLVAYSRAGFECGGLGSERGTMGYDHIALDESYGVICESCGKVYETGMAEDACKAYRLYLCAKTEKTKSIAWENFLKIRQAAERAESN